MSTESRQSTQQEQGPLGPKQRWRARRKREAALRLLLGEPLEVVSREVGVEVYRLEQWRDKVLAGTDEALKERGDDPLQGELDEAKRDPKPTVSDTALLEAIRTDLAASPFHAIARGGRG